MAVSYSSSTFKPSPYVLPLDLGLFERVMSVKQKQFDLGAAKAQSEVDQMGQLDVLKDEDRQYLNSKINNIVNTVNNLGGVDYSDMNTLNQIESLGRDVYGDDKVITALSGTASVRNLMKTYSDYKTNPKYKDKYSEVNEAYDLRKVNEWLNDKQVGSSYHGPNTATPFVNYKANLMKNIEKVKSDLNVTLDDQGLFILKESNERITPERIAAMAADLMTPEEAAQMKRDSWYLYNVQSPTSPEALVGKAVSQYQARLGDAKTLWDTYEAQAAAAVADPQARMNYNILAESAKKQYNDLKAQESKVVQSTIKSYQADPEAFGFELYKNDFFRGLGNRFSVNRTDRSIQADQGEMFERRMDQSERFHSDMINLKKEELEVAREKNAIQMYGKVYKTIDPLTGKTAYLPMGGDGLSSSGVNTEDPDGLKTTLSTLEQSNTQLTMEADRTDRKWLEDFLAQHPELATDQQTTEGGGITRILKGQQFIEDFNGRKGFQLDDLGAFNRADIVQDKLINEAGWTDSDVALMSNLYKNLQLMTEGKGSTTSKLPDGFPQVVENRMMINERIRANKEKVKAVYQTVIGNSSLTPDEKQLYNDYLQNPSRYNTGVGTTSTNMIGTSLLVRGALDPRIKAIEGKLNKQGIDVKAQVSKYIAQIPTRDVYKTKVFSDKESEESILQTKRFIAAEASRNQLGDYEVDKITPLDAGMMADGTGRFYVRAQVTTGSGEDKETKTIQIPVSDTNASVFGLSRDPYQHLNYSVGLLGRSGDIPVYGSKNMSVTVNIVKNKASELNDDSSFAQVVYKQLDANGQPTDKVVRVKMPASEGRTPSEAYVLAKKAIQEAAKNGITFEQFQEYLLNYKN